MTDSWRSAPAADVQPGDRVRLAPGREMLVSRPHRYCLDRARRRRQNGAMPELDPERILAAVDGDERLRAFVRGRGIILT
jgi:hypothetical protein